MDDSLADVNAILRQHFRAVSGRLHLLRVTLGYKHPKGFAEKLGLESATYRKYERGEALPPHEILGRIRELTGAKTDWVLYGDRSALPRDLDDAMYRALPEE